MATGRFYMFVGSIEVTRGGETVLRKSVEVHRKLINGRWVDVPPPAPAKRLSKKVKAKVLPKKLEG